MEGTNSQMKISHRPKGCLECERMLQLKLLDMEQPFMVGRAELEQRQLLVCNVDILCFLFPKKKRQWVKGEMEN